MITYNVGCFGKLPFHGDYLRPQDGRVPVAAVDGWFHAGNLDASRHSDRTQAFAASSPAFAVIPSAGQWWALAIFPSRDQVGRQYPFVLCTSIPGTEIADEIGLLPSLFAAFFQNAYLASMRGWPGDHDSLRQLLANLGGQVDPGQEARFLANTLASITARQLWSGLLGSFEDVRKQRILGRVVELAATGRSDWGMRIAPTVHQAHASFWLWLVSLLRDPPGQPDLIVMHPAASNRPPAMVVLWDRPSPETYFAALWPACSIGVFDARIHDLLADQGSGIRIEGVDDEVGQPELSLRDLLHTLATPGRNLAQRTRRFSRSGS